MISNYDDLDNPYYGGGGAIAVHECAKRLQKQFNVTVLTGTYPGAKDRIRDGVQYKHIGLPFGGGKFGQLVYQLLLVYYLKRLPFSIWIESFTPPFSTSCLQLFTRKPVIGLVHMLSGKDMKRKYHLPFDRIEARGLTTYNTFIVASESIQQTIKKHNPNALIALIPNGVDQKRVAQHTKKDYFLYLGRIEINQKGLDLLLKSYAQIADKTAYPLVIAGGGAANEEARLRELIISYHLEKRVTLVGRVSGTQKSDLFKKAVAVVVPSRFETFSLVSLETLAAGIPLITFAIEGLSWIPETCAVKVAEDTTSLAGAMERVARDSKLRKSLSDQAIAFSKKMRWSSVADSYARLLQQF